jgi:hypothetical protein
MSVTITDMKPVQKIGATETTTDPIFRLTYKHAHMIQDLYFQSHDLQAAIKLGNKFCVSKRMRFITVTPFIQDLQRMMNPPEEIDENQVAQ